MTPTDYIGSILGLGLLYILFVIADKQWDDSRRLPDVPPQFTDPEAPGYMDPTMMF